ncbi:hypothetical protein M0802_005223 [Mischocyttarus mexicanus]|nr:hypothetical protein M0802_005223 [Mischocyttarus mexicanus]
MATGKGNTRRVLCGGDGVGNGNGDGCGGGGSGGSSKGGELSGFISPGYCTKSTPRVEEHTRDGRKTQNELPRLRGLPFRLSKGVLGETGLGWRLEEERLEGVEKNRSSSSRSTNRSSIFKAAAGVLTKAVPYDCFTSYHFITYFANNLTRYTFKPMSIVNKLFDVTILKVGSGSAPTVAGGSVDYGGG